MRVIQSTVAMLLLANMIASCTPPEERNLKFKLPAQLFTAKKQIAGDIGSKIIPDFCNYNAEGLTCVAIPAEGNDEAVSTPSASLECSFQLPKDRTYQIFLRQNGVLCAEILQSTSFVPTLLGKSELDFDVGQLVSSVNGTIHTQNDPESSSDTDGDSIADEFDEDLDGNGILDVNEDCDQDGLPDAVDADKDGDAILNRDDTETVCTN